MKHDRRCKARRASAVGDGQMNATFAPDWLQACDGAAMRKALRRTRRSAAMKSAVIVFPASNCDRDAQMALKR